MEKELEFLCKEYAQRYGYGQERIETGLEMLAIHITALEDAYYGTYLDGEREADVDLRQCSAGGANDLKIDGLLVSEDGKRVTIIQAAHRNKFSHDLVDKASGFFGNVDFWLREPEENRGNSNVQTLLDEADLDPRKQDIELAFYTTVPINSPQASVLIETAEKFTDDYSNKSWNVRCVVLGPSEIVARRNELMQALSGGKVDVTLDIQFQEGKFFVTNEPHRALIGSIKASAIGDLFRRKDVGNRLFNDNIRYALANTSINKEIEKTLKDKGESTNFFYYNNGITATCRSFNIEKNRVSVEHLQVVNGAQTVNSIAQALKRSEEATNAEVLFRLIEVDEGYGKTQFKDLITQYQNTQNPVKAADFWANHPFQLYLDSTLEKEISGRGCVLEFTYARKRGQTQGGKRKNRLVDLERLAQLRHALLYGPQLGYSSPKAFWDKTEGEATYWEAFGVEGEPVSNWPKEEFWKIGWALTAYFRIKDQALQIKKESPDNEESSYLGYLARFVTALSYRLMEKKFLDGEIETWQGLMNSKQQFETTLKDTVLASRKEVRREITNRRESGGEANPRLNLGRDGKAFDRIAKQLVQGEDLSWTS